MTMQCSPLWKRAQAWAGRTVCAPGSPKVNFVLIILDKEAA